MDQSSAALFSQAAADVRLAQPRAGSRDRPTDSGTGQLHRLRDRVKGTGALPRA